MLWKWLNRPTHEVQGAPDGARRVDPGLGAAPWVQNPATCCRSTACSSSLGSRQSVRMHIIHFTEIRKCPITTMHGLSRMRRTSLASP